MHQPHPENLTLLNRAIVGALLFFAMLLVGIQTARAACIPWTPSVGLTRAVHGDHEATPSAELGMRTTTAGLALHF
jgi:hypothetical protein